MSENKNQEENDSIMTLLQGMVERGNFPIHNDVSDTDFKTLRKMEAFHLISLSGKHSYILTQKGYEVLETGDFFSWRNRDSKDSFDEILKELISYMDVKFADLKFDQADLANELSKIIYDIIDRLSFNYDNKPTLVRLVKMKLAEMCITDPAKRLTVQPFFDHLFKGDGLNQLG